MAFSSAMIKINETVGNCIGYPPPWSLRFNLKDYRNYQSSRSRWGVIRANTYQIRICSALNFDSAAVHDHSRLPL